MEKKYYLPINSTSLAHYFGSACIKPSKYFGNKQEDLQDKFNDFLLITTHRGTQQTDCCLELVLTKHEVGDLIDVKNGFYFYEKPLPITRIRKIYFSNKERKEQTITNISMSTAFVPNALIELVNTFDNPQIDIKKPQNIEIFSYEKQIKTFNSFLGGLALMRLAGEEYMNYSENYFATLSFFNNKIEKDLEYSSIAIDNRYRGAFTGENGFQKIIPYLNKTIDEPDVNNIAQEENQVVKKDKITRIIDLDTFDRWTYTVAVLNTYGVDNESKKKKIDELILSNFKSEIRHGKSEGIALCYGMNRGYSAFSNRYNLKNNEKIVKFQLNSQLDYYTIESLFQYIFNNRKSDEFPYLDWCPKQKTSKISKKKDYKILDVVVIGKKKAKVSSLEYLENLLSLFFQKDSFPLFKAVFEKVREIIYNDTKEEITEDYENQIAQKQAEIDKLKVEQKELLKYPKVAPVEKEEQQEEKVIQTIAEQPISYSSKQNVRKIVEQVYDYQSKTKDMLKKEAKERNINLSSKADKNEIIIALLATSADTNSDPKLFEDE